MQARRKHMRERLARRARQGAEAEYGKRRHLRELRKAQIMAAFGRRRLWFVALIVASLLLPILLAAAPDQILQSYALLILVVVFVIRMAPLAARYTVWRCPNCNRVLPLNTRFGPFEHRRENCPYCGARLE